MLASMFLAVSPSTIFSPSGGTLVIVVPTSEGVVIAADKRTSPGGVYCDGVAKILQPPNHANMAVFITGLSTLRDHSTIKPEDLCKALASTPAPIDFGRSTLAFLEKQPAPISELNGQALTEMIYADIKQFIEGGQLNSLMGQRIATIVVVDHEAATRTSRIWSFWVQLTGPVGFQLQPAHHPLKFGPTDRPVVLPYGENEYYYTHVLNGVGRDFIDENLHIVSNAPNVSLVAVDAGAGAAINLIEAASKAADLVKPPSGIGGGVDCVLVGQERKILR
jgi:hypothetical protein